MLVSSSTAKPLGNDLYRLVAVSSVLVGLFFAAGASGHIVAVWPMVVGETNDFYTQRQVLLLPGFVLATSCLVNFCACWPLWQGKRWALHLALIINLLASLYLGYLLHRGIPDHPIAVFLAVASTQVILLGAIKAGFIWPTVG